MRKKFLRTVEKHNLSLKANKELRGLYKCFSFAFSINYVIKVSSSNGKIKLLSNESSFHSWRNCTLPQDFYNRKCIKPKINFQLFGVIFVGLVVGFINTFVIG